MKYLSLDIETTSLTANPDNILMISMVVEDSKKDIPVKDLPHFTCFIKQNKPLVGDYYALAMNAWILDILAGRNKNPKHPIYTNYPAVRPLPPKMPDNVGRIANIDPSQIVQEVENLYWVERATQFLKAHFGEERITVAGKNVAGFDIPFLPREIRDRFRHRTLDAGSFFINWEVDTAPPDLKLCKQRAGLAGEVAHDAYDDACDVIECLRLMYRRKA